MAAKGWTPGPFLVESANPRPRLLYYTSYTSVGTYLMGAYTTKTGRIETPQLPAG